MDCVAVSVNWESFFVSVLTIIRALPLGIYIRAPDFRKLEKLWQSPKNRSCHSPNVDLRRPGSHATPTHLHAVDRRPLIISTQKLALHQPRSPFKGALQLALKDKAFWRWRDKWETVMVEAPPGRSCIEIWSQGKCSFQGVYGSFKRVSGSLWKGNV